MLKIAVTGHTAGLGKAFFDHYQNLGHSVSGYSRQNGFDLRDWATIQKFLDVTENFDLLISNAKPDFFQTILLYELCRRDKKVSKIISIGSCIVNFELPQSVEIGINLYKTQKLSLQNAHQQLTRKYKNFNSFLIHPAHLYDSDEINYNHLEQWISRMELAMQNNLSKELYVE
jgi:hypothetical protein